jgi:hypothetical protein
LSQATRRPGLIDIIAGFYSHIFVFTVEAEIGSVGEPERALGGPIPILVKAEKAIYISP